MEKKTNNMLRTRKNEKEKVSLLPFTYHSFLARWSFFSPPYKISPNVFLIILRYVYIKWCLCAHKDDTFIIN
jgi:hypothetical protein